ncbi:MAG: hypothetical protein R3B13_00935 [Polyangiaceae bacterium]
MSNDPESWTIERIVPGGDGMAHLGDGRVAFASSTAPGDVIAVRRRIQKKSYARALDYEVVKPGEGRVSPECPHAAECGGCDLMHLSRATELEAKRSILDQALQRTGGFHDLGELPPLITAGAELGYRTRLRVHVARSGRLGLYAEKSHLVVPIRRCAVARDPINAALERVASALSEHAALVEAIAELELQVDDDDRVMLFASPRDGVEPTRAQIAVAAALGPEGWAVAGVKQHGEPQRFRLDADLTLLAPAGVFVQVNWEVNRKLVGDVVAEAAALGVQRFVELYCGAGNFSLPLARGRTGVAVDRDGAGLRSAQQVAKAQDLQELSFLDADLARGMPKLPKRMAKPDLLVLDPPRTGAKHIIGDVARLRAKHIAYVSCDPVTLARDAKLLVEYGYGLRKVQAYDMFPRTHHFETVMWLAEV